MKVPKHKHRKAAGHVKLESIMRERERLPLFSPSTVFRAHFFPFFACTSLLFFRNEGKSKLLK